MARNLNFQLEIKHKGCWRESKITRDRSCDVVLQPHRWNPCHCHHVDFSTAFYFHLFHFSQSHFYYAYGNWSLGLEVKYKRHSIQIRSQSRPNDHTLHSQWIYMPTSLALYIITVCICNICVCVCIYINAYLFLNITLSFHNVTCMYIFRDDHLALTNNWCAFSLGKNISLNPSFPQLLIVLCVGLRSHGIFPHPLMHVQIISPVLQM